MAAAKTRPKTRYFDSYFDAVTTFLTMTDTWYV